MASKDSGKKPHKPTKTTTKSSYYQVSGESISRSRNSCPKCGLGVFMGDHKDRAHCGRCSFTEFKT